MSYAHSFSPEFYGDAEHTNPSERPTSVIDALTSMPEEEWRKMSCDVFRQAPERLTVDEVLERIIETNTVSNLNSPVEVWIDTDGFYRVLVYERAV